MKRLVLAALLFGGLLALMNGPVQAAFENIYDDAALSYGPMDSFSNWKVVPDAAALNGAFRQAAQPGSQYSFSYDGNGFVLSYHLPPVRAGAAAGGCMARVTVRHDSSLDINVCIRTAGKYFVFRDAASGIHTTTVTLDAGVLTVDWVGIQGELR